MRLTFAEQLNKMITAGLGGAQVVYDLAEPETVELTAQQLSSLIGTNNVWSNADSVSLTYGNIYYTEGY